MAAPNPSEAVRNVIEPLRDVLRCITMEYLGVAERAGSPRIGQTYPISIGLQSPVLLRTPPGTPSIGLTIAQELRLGDTGSARRHERFVVSLVRYYYALTTRDGAEIIAYHRAPETQDPHQKTFPHLHVGSINLRPDAPVRSGTFNRAHFPTGRVSVVSIIRLAIEEFDVQPLRRDWDTVLTQCDSLSGSGSL